MLRSGTSRVQKSQRSWAGSSLGGGSLEGLSQQPANTYKEVTETTDPGLSQCCGAGGQEAGTRRDQIRYKHKDLPQEDSQATGQVAQ